MTIKYLNISCFLYILVSYSQALAGVENCKIVSVTHCDDCAPVEVKCGMKQGYVNNIVLNHIKVKVMNLSDSTEVTYQLDSPPDRILQYRNASAANQLNPWIRNEVRKRFEMKDLEFNESNLLIRIAEDGFGLDGEITLYRNPQREGGATISSVLEVPFSNTCEYIAPPWLLSLPEHTKICMGKVICEIPGSPAYTTTVVCFSRGNKCPSAIECYIDKSIDVTTPENKGLIRIYDSKSGLIINPGK